MNQWCQPLTKDTCRVAIRLTPNAKREGVVGVTYDEGANEYLKVSIRAVPEKGKANKALIEFVAKQLSIPKSYIEILSGHTSRLKILRVHALQVNIMNLNTCVEPS